MVGPVQLVGPVVMVATVAQLQLRQVAPEQYLRAPFKPMEAAAGKVVMVAMAVQPLVRPARPRELAVLVVQLVKLAMAAPYH